VKIQPIYPSLPALSMADVVEQELPFTQEMYRQKEQLHQDIQHLFSFYIQHKNRLPMYALDQETAESIMADFNDYAAMTMAALEKMFAQSDDEIKHWYACSNIEKPGFDSFLAYARYMFQRRKRAFSAHPDTIYGRIDGMVDPRTGQLKGVYEINGDTPVMLFESVNLQNILSTMLGTPDAQANEWWDASVKRLASFQDKAVAIVCDVKWIEDTVTSETIAQAFHAAGARAYFTSMTGLNHDLLNLHQPFIVDGVHEPMDAVFMLLPWEEMWVSGADILSHWERWADHVIFYEPAWRWFMSHKAMLAWITYLLETDEVFYARWGKTAHLRTYLTPDRFIQERRDYVSKPVLGRLSQNISIIKNGITEVTTDGMYSHEPMVYQEYLAPGQVQGRNNFIVGAWMSAGNVTSLCFREFDGAVLNLSNERFIAHQLVNV
jgi:glutathionylspermidine synthase